MGEWKNGLFGCFSDIKICLITYIAPCYTQGKIAESLGEDCLMNTIYAIIPFVNIYCAWQQRGKVRDKKGIDGTPMMDLLMICCCGACALCQEAQELETQLLMARS